MPKFRTPVRDVLLLPDDYFFVRTIPLAVEGPAEAVRNQVELALEALAPFPLAQLFYGYWTRPGAGRVLVYAAYRKRFSAEEIDAWATADWVAPRFAALLGTAAPAPGTTWLLANEEVLTALHFADGSGVPAAVRTGRIEAGSPSDRQRVREALLRATGGTRQVVEVAAVEVAAGEPGDASYVVRGGDLRSEFDVAQAELLDVRDKGELSGRRRARVRDRWLWRGLLAGLVAFALCAAAELLLIGLQVWQNAREERIARQTPVVSQIMTAHSLAGRIEEMSTMRLRPKEMIEMIVEPMPSSIQFLNTTTNGLFTLDVQAQTRRQDDIDRYRSALAERPETANVTVEVQRTQNNITTFRLQVTFEPTAFRNREEAAP